MSRSIARLLAFVLCGVAATALSADGYGTVKGRFILKGKAPEAKPIAAAGDGAALVGCGPGAVPDESLVVNPDGGGIANIFIWLPRPNGDVAPNLLKQNQPTVSIDQKGCVFKPHAFVVRTDQKMVLLNDDPVAHNVHTYPLRGNPINVLIAANDRQGVKADLEKAEILPIPVKCDIHPWMQAYCLVVDNPYAVVTNEKGEFEIKDVPAGVQAFRTWHEGNGYIDRAMNVVVQSGETRDLGDIQIELPNFRRVGNLPKDP